MNILHFVNPFTCMFFHLVLPQGQGDLLRKNG